MSHFLLWYFCPKICKKNTRIKKFQSMILYSLYRKHLFPKGYFLKCWAKMVKLCRGNSFMLMIDKQGNRRWCLITQSKSQGTCLWRIYILPLSFFSHSLYCPVPLGWVNPSALPHHDKVSGNQIQTFFSVNYLRYSVTMM